LYNDSPIGRRVLFTKDFAALLIFIFVFFIFNVRGADVTIFCRNVCPLTWAVLLHMANSMAVVALNA
jgi:hypothetical protein